MKARRGSLGFAVLSLLLPLSAQGQRTFVSAQHGSDVNPCSVTSPCRTFGAAIAAVPAGGEVIVLDSGGYGGVSITKAVAITAPAGIYAGIHVTSGDAITVNAGSSDDVVLRGLTLNGGPGNGITFVTGSALHIESCLISGFGAASKAGISLQASSANTFVTDTISRQNQTGFSALDGRASVDHCRFEGNFANGVSMQGADVSLRDSISAGNNYAGFVVFAVGSQNTVSNLYQSTSTNNLIDGLTVYNTGSGFVIVRVGNSAIIENLNYGINNSGGGGFVSLGSLGNNMVEGNIAGDTSGAISTLTPK
jgi:Right handed beta helix region